MRVHRIGQPGDFLPQPLHTWHAGLPVRIRTQTGPHQAVPMSHRVSLVSLVSDQDNNLIYKSN